MTFEELRDALIDALKKHDLPATTQADVKVVVDELQDPIDITELHVVHRRDGSTSIYLKGEGP